MPASKSLDDLVCPGQQRRRNGQPDALAVLRLNKRDPWWRAAQHAIPHQPAAGRGRGRDDPRTSEPEGGPLTTKTRHDVDFWTRAIRRR
jgi:hypothetical protein